MRRCHCIAFECGHTPLVVQLRLLLHVVSVAGVGLIRVRRASRRTIDSGGLGLSRCDVVHFEDRNLRKVPNVLLRNNLLAYGKFQI